MLNKDEQELEKLMKTSGKIWNLTRVLELGKIWIEVCEGALKKRNSTSIKNVEKKVLVTQYCLTLCDPMD